MKPYVLLLMSLPLIALNHGASAHGYWRDRPADDREQIRQQMRDHWQQGGQHGRQGVAGFDQQGGARRRDLPPDDRRRLRDEMRGRAVPPSAPEGRPQGS